MKIKNAVIIVILILIIVAFRMIYLKPIGTVVGPEWDTIIVKGVEYVSRSSSHVDIPHDRSDKGRHMGIIKSGDNVFHIYEVKGDKERNYLYWKWEWEGRMYIRKELSDAVKK